jgi:glycosyltransferase involved in cell wall biosynthesis
MTRDPFNDLKMSVSVIIPAHNEEKMIGECLDSVLDSCRDRLLEIIVIDNASTDRTGEVAASRRGVRILYEEKKSLLHARSRGLREAKGEFVVYLDADSRLQEGWIERMEQVLHEDPTIVALSGAVRYFDASSWHSIVLWFCWRTIVPAAYKLVGYMIIGTHFVVRKRDLCAVGGFDPTIDFYGEDTDLARRLSARGKVLFRSDCFVLTSARRFAVEGLFKTCFVYAINFIWPALFGKPFSLSHRDLR